MAARGAKLEGHSLARKSDAFYIHPFVPDIRLWAVPVCVLAAVTVGPIRLVDRAVSEDPSKGFPFRSIGTCTRALAKVEEPLCSIGIMP